MRRNVYTSLLHSYIFVDVIYGQPISQEKICKAVRLFATFEIVFEKKYKIIIFFYLSSTKPTVNLRALS